MPGAAAGHAALSEFSNRETLDTGVRLSRRSEAVRLAICLLAVSSREAGDGISGDHVHDRGHGHARRSHARQKMAALMQAEAANGHSRERPILLRIEPKAGHGAGKPITKQIEEGTDIYSFLFWQLGRE